MFWYWLYLQQLLRAYFYLDCEPVCFDRYEDDSHLFTPTRCFRGGSQPFCHCEWEGMRYFNDHWFEISSLYMIIYLKQDGGLFWSYVLSYLQIMLNCNKLIYCNITVRLRHLVLFSYKWGDWGGGVVTTVIFFFSGASVHTRVRS